MPDILNAMREFRALDDKRRGPGLEAEEEKRWNELRALLKGDVKPPKPAAASAPSRENDSPGRPAAPGTGAPLRAGSGPVAPPGSGAFPSFSLPTDRGRPAGGTAAGPASPGGKSLGAWPRAAAPPAERPRIAFEILPEEPEPGSKAPAPAAPEPAAPGSKPVGAPKSPSPGVPAPAAAGAVPFRAPQAPIGERSAAPAVEPPLPPAERERPVLAFLTPESLEEPEPAPLEPWAPATDGARPVERPAERKPAPVAGASAGATAGAAGPRAPVGYRRDPWSAPAGEAEPPTRRNDPAPAPPDPWGPVLDAPKAAPRPGSGQWDFVVGPVTPGPVAPPIDLWAQTAKRPAAAPEPAPASGADNLPFELSRGPTPPGPVPVEEIESGFADWEGKTAGPAPAEPPAGASLLPWEVTGAPLAPSPDRPAEEAAFPEEIEIDEISGPIAAPAEERDVPPDEEVEIVELAEVVEAGVSTAAATPAETRDDPFSPSVDEALAIEAAFAEPEAAGTERASGVEALEIEEAFAEEERAERPASGTAAEAADPVAPELGIATIEIDPFDDAEAPSGGRSEPVGAEARTIAPKDGGAPFAAAGADRTAESPPSTARVAASDFDLLAPEGSVLGAAVESSGPVAQPFDTLAIDEISGLDGLEPEAAGSDRAAQEPAAVGDPVRPAAPADFATAALDAGGPIEAVEQVAVDAVAAETVELEPLGVEALEAEPVAAIDPAEPPFVAVGFEAAAAPPDDDPIRPEAAEGAELEVLELSEADAIDEADPAASLEVVAEVLPIATGDGGVGAASQPSAVAAPLDRQPGRGDEAGDPLEAHAPSAGVADAPSWLEGPTGLETPETGGAIGPRPRPVHAMGPMEAPSFGATSGSGVATGFADADRGQAAAAPESDLLDSLPPLDAPDLVATDHRHANAPSDLLDALPTLDTSDLVEAEAEPAAVPPAPRAGDGGSGADTAPGAASPFPGSGSDLPFAASPLSDLGDLPEAEDDLYPDPLDYDRRSLELAPAPFDLSPEAEDTFEAAPLPALDPNPAPLGPAEPPRPPPTRTPIGRIALVAAAAPADSGRGSGEVPLRSQLVAPPPAAAPTAAPSPAAAGGGSRVVIHTRDGVVKRGTVDAFDPRAERFHLRTAEGADEEIATAGLKAVFFMRAPGEGAPAQKGKPVRITFVDNRPLQGWAEDLDDPIGFFLVPADVRGNASRVFVYRAAIRELREA